MSSIRVSDATGQRAAVLAASAGLTVGEPVDRTLDEDEHASFWRRTREALAQEPGVELEDHDVFAPALEDGLDRG